MTETELRDAYGLTRHEPRTYEGGTGCSCGRDWPCSRVWNHSLDKAKCNHPEWGTGWLPPFANVERTVDPHCLRCGITRTEYDASQPHQHTPSDPEPGCEFCAEPAK